MEAVKLGKSFEKLAKRPEPVPEIVPGVGPKAVLTLDDVVGWDGEEGVMARLLEGSQNIAEALCKTGAIVEGVVLPKQLVFVYDGKLFKSQSYVLTVRAAKLFKELRGTDVAVKSVRVVLKQSKTNPRKYYDFEVEYGSAGEWAKESKW